MGNQPRQRGIRDRNKRESRRLALYSRPTEARDLEDMLNTFEARSRALLSAWELRVLRRRREAFLEAEALLQPVERHGTSRKPSLNEYEGHE